MTYSEHEHEFTFAKNRAPKRFQSRVLKMLQKVGHESALSLMPS